jgi:hypothetical protein
MPDNVIVDIVEMVEDVLVNVQDGTDNVTVEILTVEKHASSHLMGHTDPIFPIATLDLDTTAGEPSYSEGRVFWDSNAKTWAIMTSPDTTLQIGQESVLLVKNETEVTITNGTPVKIIGGNGHPIVAPVTALAMDADASIGVTTQDIPPSSTGFIVSYGLLNGFDTSGYAINDTLYLAQAGGLTNEKPKYPNTVVHTAHVTHVGETDGQIFVDIFSESSQKFFDVFRFAGVTDKAQIALSYTPSTRKMIVSPVGDYWAYFYEGQEFRKTAPLELVHPNTTGLHFFYLDSNGDITTSTYPWDLMTTIPLMVCYYNSVTVEGIAFDERHRIGDKEWHRGQHNNIGTYYVSGLGASGYTLLSHVNADIQFGISAGVIRDEDLGHNIIGQADGGTYNVLWRDGVDGNWRLTTGSFPFLYGTYAKYNQNTGSTWQMTEIGNNEYLNVYVVATPALDGARQVLCVPSQVKHSTLANATNASVFTDISWGALPFVEFSVLHKFTYRGGSSYTSTGKVRIELYTDLRGTTKSIQVSGGAGTSHNGLTGLNTGDFIHLTQAEYIALIPEAPTDGKMYGRKNGAWVEIV